MNQVRAKLQVNFDPGQAQFFFWCENKAKVIRGTAVWPKYSMPAIYVVSLVFSSLHLGKATLDSGKLDLGLVSVGSNGIEPQANFCRYKKVIICALHFIQFVVYSMRNPVVYRTAKKVVFC